MLIDVLAAALPPGPAYYPDGELTDEPEEVLMSEFIREAALEGVHDELPHHWQWLSTRSIHERGATT